MTANPVAPRTTPQPGWVPVDVMPSYILDGAGLDRDDSDRARWSRVSAWPTVAAALILACVVAWVLASVLPGTGHIVVYGLDDPYIHMAMAKNIVRHGIWGIDGSGFTSSSSSLLWTSLLAGHFFAFGVRDTIPLILNVLAALVLLLGSDRIMRRDAPGAPASVRFVALATIVLCTPLPALIIAGQEHTLHALITLAFAVAAARYLRSENRSIPWLLPALAAALTLARYEGLFLAAVVSILLGARGRWLTGAAVLAGVGAPLIIYGAISVSLGWWWVPNSVLIKGWSAAGVDASSVVDRIALVANGYQALLRIPAIGFLVQAAVLIRLANFRQHVWSTGNSLSAIFLGTSLLHMQFAQLPAFWLFRYEAYLIPLGVVSIVIAASEARKALGANEVQRSGLAKAWQAGLIVILLLSPLSTRALQATRILPSAIANIHEQQYQMGRFVHQYYDGASIALNDIGAVNYLADVRTLDLMGLADMEVARLRTERRFYQETLTHVAASRDVRLAIVYSYSFNNALVGGVPKAWIAVADWTIRNVVVVGGPTVTFYANGPAEALRLRANLRQFSRELPPGVSVSFH